MNLKRPAILLLALSLGTLAACEDRDSAQQGARAGRPAPAVTVTPVISKPVAASVDFIGQAEAFQSVDLRARVTGFLLKQAFKEGAAVKKGDILFVIDPSEHNAARDVAAAKVERANATIQEAENQLARYRKLAQTGTFSQAQLDAARAKEGQARADLAAAEAELKRAELDVGYTTIKSPIDGRIGASAVDAGNLIGPDSGVLATVVALDPIRVNFTVSERAYLDYTQAKMKGEATGFTPRIRLANDQEYPHDGKLDFIDNRVDPSTGTIKVRVEFPNPDSLILPGQFMNVTLVSANPKNEMVVPQAAVQANQTGPFVLVVNKDNKVELRPVKTGERIGAEIAVTEGLSIGESIIVEGIQKVRPGAAVKPVPLQKSASAK
ncbi:Efflux pump periplasmic linker BepF [bacterium BMS3Bbin10]|nr:Efflux pump periplasmic linker BepF [bacterium BMS3Bbin10]